MVTSKLELLVEFGSKPDEKLLNKTLSELKSKDGIVEATYKNGAVVVETTLPSAVVVDMTSRVSGKRTVLQGFGDSQQSAVVAIGGGGDVSGGGRGVVRLSQTVGGALLVEGTVDGLRAGGEHALSVRVTGDLSQGCASLGDVYQPGGDLGKIKANEEGRAQFRIVSDDLKVCDLIGRSIAIAPAQNTQNGNTHTSERDDKLIACGIIARSAGIFENPKRICACDGVVVWDERDRPLAGKGRREARPCCGKGTEETKRCCQ